MALEACFHLSTTSPTPSPTTTTRASAPFSYREKKLSLVPNRDRKRSLRSSPSSSSSSSVKRTGIRLNRFICQAKNAVDEVLEVTDESWNELVLESKIPVVVKFWAPSCGPCKLMEPLFVELAKEYSGKIACYKINTDDSLKLASRYGIRNIPTVLFLKNGEDKESITGAVKKSALCATVEKYL